MVNMTTRTGASVEDQRRRADTREVSELMPELWGTGVGCRYDVDRDILRLSIAESRRS